MNGTAWILGGGYPWRSADPDAELHGWTSSPVVVNPSLGLSLAALPGGPLGLRSPDDSLGRLTLPRGIAVDGRTVLVLSTDGRRILRYDAVRETLEPLPEVGAEGLRVDPPDEAFAEPRRFQGASNVAAVHGALYVADPAARRVQVFELASLALVRIHSGLQEPVDVAAGGDHVYVLERATASVFAASPFRDDLRRVVHVPSMAGRWDRIAVDREGRIYLRDSAARPPLLHVFVPGPEGAACRPAARVANSDEVRDRFDGTGIHLDNGAIVLPVDLRDPCRLRSGPEPGTQVWHVGGRVVTVDTRLRVLTVHLADGRIRQRFGPIGPDGREVGYDDAGAWSPVDVIGVDTCVLVLDERHRIVYALQNGAESLRRWFGAPADHPRSWRRIAVDETGCLLLWDGVGDVVDRVDQRGRLLGELPYGELRGRFDRARRKPQPAAPPVRLTRDGAVRVRGSEPRRYPEPAYVTHGVWTSTWLDSGLYNCQWHVLELGISSLPPGSRLLVRTRTSNEAQSDAEALASLGTVGALGSWRDAPALVGAPQPSADEAGPRTVDVLVPSGPGQFLQLQVELTGSSLSTPVVERVRIQFPRESLLQYLPALYSKPEEQRDFLDRFLSIPQRTWSDIERELATFSRFLDPDSVPADAMGWLAEWLGLTLEGTWTVEQNRRLLQAMPGLRTLWGTAAGIRAWVRVYLANMAGVAIDALEQAGVPGIVESFVDRRQLMLNHPDGAAVCTGGALWSPAVERRFQVGVFDREGEIELVSSGRPDLDVFARYAHRFRVFVPSPFVRTAADEALLRRAIDMQKPAHTTYELVLVEPRFRIGEQSTIDLDTVIGAPEPGALLCAAVDDPPARPPYGRLNFDSTLGCGCRTVGGARAQPRLTEGCHEVR